MNRTGAGAERVSQAEDAQMPMWGDQGLRRVFPSLELTAAACGAEHKRRHMRHRMRLQARIRQKMHEQVSKEQNPGNGLAEGAVKELKRRFVP